MVCVHGRHIGDDVADDFHGEVGERFAWCVVLMQLLGLGGTGAGSSAEGLKLAFLGEEWHFGRRLLENFMEMIWLGEWGLDGVYIVC